MHGSPLHRPARTQTLRGRGARRRAPHALALRVTPGDRNRRNRCAVSDSMARIFPAEKNPAVKPKRGPSVSLIGMAEERGITGGVG